MLMKHYSEHTLDHYIRKSDVIVNEQEDIERHLLQCASCRAVADDLRAFYDLAESKNKLLNASIESEDTLVVQPEYIRTRPLTQIQMPNSLPQRVWHIARKRSIVSGVSFLGMVAAIVFFIRSVVPTESKNPEFIRVNNGSSRLEVYNHESKLVWSIPWTTKGYSSVPEESWNNSNSAVSDIDKDGTNEILSIIPTLNNRETVNGKIFLQVFSHEKNILFTKELGETVHYGNDEYIPQFMPRGMIVDDFNGDGNKEIIVGAPHRHSPYILYRLDSQGNMLGKYIHYGHFWGIYAVNFEGRKAIVLCGIDDKYDKPVIVVLNPQKLVGTTYSTTHPEFGMSTMHPEIYYVGLPHTLFDIGEKPKPRVVAKFFETENMLSFWVANATSYAADDLQNCLEYTFTKEMVIHDIRVNDGSRRLYERWKKEGKIHENLADAYLQGLKEKIQYWDRLQWQNNKVEVGVSIAGK